ncbi:MAG: DNA translocase FtsK 4TM domain-containing protein [Alphaproteobacteria bacterium]|nr:DNA translocase FtsK 4TM domain-containing protein [Alphaproteobacteria bacterium]
MATASRKTAFLPPGAAEFLRRRAVELVGLALFLSAVALFLALVTYRPSDPSFNTASTRHVANLMGPLGAYVSDLLLQTLGLAGALTVPILGAWGVRLLRRHAIPVPLLRLALLPLALLTAAVAVAALDRPRAWPLDSGMGGFVGKLLLSRLIEGFSLMRLAVDGAWVFAILGGASGVLMYYVLGYSTEEWQRAGVILNGAAGAVGRTVRWPFQFLRPRPKTAKAVNTKRPKRKEPLLTPKADPPPERPAVRQPERRMDDLVETPGARTKPSKRAVAARQRKLDLPRTDAGIDLPPLELLEEVPEVPADARAINEEALHQNARLLEGVLEDFGVRGEVVKVRPGPVVTLYELEPAPGTKTSRVIGLSDDIARSMSSVSVRIAVIPGRNVIGIELPNQRRETVYLRELLASRDYEKAAGKLPLVLGKDIGGGAIITDLARMPHLLIAGTTGSGKSVGLNAMILSLLYRHSPNACKLILIDPKMLELSVYDDIPHLIAPVVTDPRKAVVALKWTVREMEERYQSMSKLGVRNIEGYNRRIAEAARKGEEIIRKVQTGFDSESGKPIIEEQPLDLVPLPYIVVVVDEMADLMLVAGKDIEASIQRLAQMARAAGIHLIMATQRPSVDVITGTIKANFPTRVSFQVTSKIDSRTILGEQGAEQLLGQGDMLHMAGGGRITRVHGPFVDDGEVEQVANFLKSQGDPIYIDAITEDDGEMALTLDGGAGGDSGDELYDRAVALVAEEQKASTSFIQRHLQIGYNRAARIVERMEKEGVVGPANHVGKREILIGSH